MKQFCLIFLALFAAQIFADVSYITRGAFTSQDFQPTFSEESSEDYEEPPIRIPGNTFTGTYTVPKGVDGPKRTYICVDKYNQIQGSYDEVGMIQAFVTEDENGTIAEGFFYEAGSTCTWGEIKLILTTYGFKAIYNCGGEGDEFEFEQVLLNPYRPSDDQCVLLDLVANETLDGSWQDVHGHPMDICVTELRWQLSYLRDPDNASGPGPHTLVDGYAIGTTFVDGKVLSGTWYEEDSAGAIIIFYRQNGELQYWRWTGLLGNQGRTVIDTSQFYNTRLHRTVYYPTKTDRTATPKECSRFAPVKDYVLATLRQDDGDYYYFVEDDVFTTEYYNIYYTSATTVYVNTAGAAGLFVSSFLLAVALALLI